MTRPHTGGRPPLTLGEKPIRIEILMPADLVASLPVKGRAKYIRTAIAEKVDREAREATLLDADQQDASE